MNFVAIIPARYASTRFPGKPLALVQGKPMIQCVYEQVTKVIPQTWVATDDERIANAVKNVAGKVIMTSTKHPTGTDRIIEASHVLQNQIDFDVVVNVQGDEPFIDIEHLEAICSLFKNPSVEIATLCTPLQEEETTNPNAVKVIFNEDGTVKFFGRSASFFETHEKQFSFKTSRYTFHKHLGIYAYKKEVLEEIATMEVSPLEQIEKLEQLRWLENRKTIAIAVVKKETQGIDTPEDLLKVNNAKR